MKELGGKKGELVGLDLPSAGQGTEASSSPHNGAIVWIRGEAYKAHSEAAYLWQSKQNANQNHNEVPLHASQDGCYPKVDKQQMLEMVWRKGNPLTLLVEMQTSTAAMENSVEIS